MALRFLILGPADSDVLASIAAGVFDHEIDEQLTAEFLSDPRHHLAVAVDHDVVIGMASAVHYVHPDKRQELWINEVGVAPTHRRLGVGRALLRELLQLARTLGCHEAWVLTDPCNEAANALYARMPEVEAPRSQVMFTFRL